MIDLFLPLVIGLAAGIEPPEAGMDADAMEVAAVEDPVAQEAAPLVLGSGDDLGADREPEPQIPMGKFTTALEVKPIMQMTRNQWVGVREFNGQDYVYFTQMLAWRCGLWDIRYGINDAPADTVLAMEPCNEGFAQPNAMIDLETYLPYVVLPLNSVQSIYVEIVFDDGTTDFARFERNAIRIP